MSRMLGEAFVTIRPTAPGFGTETEAMLKRQLAAVKPEVKIGGDTTKLLAAAKVAQRYINSMNADIKVGTNATGLTGQIAAIKSAMKGLGDVGIGTSLDTRGTLAKLAALRAAIDGMPGMRDVLGVQDVGAGRAMAASIGAASNAMHDYRKSVDDAWTSVGLASVAQRAFDDGLKKIEQDAPKAASQLSFMAKTGAGAFGLFGARLNLFGGAATVGVIHTIVSGVIELASVLIPATIAFAAFAAVAAPTFAEIAKQMQNVFIVSDAVDKSIYPLSNSFNTLAKAVQPEAMQLFGEALVLVNAKAGAFVQLAQGAGSVLDRLGARMVAAMTSSEGFGAFLGHAVSDLQKFGDVIGNLFGILGNFLHAVPGVAEVLLNVADNATKVTEAITGSGFVQGIIKAGLAFHGIFVYAGLATTAVLMLKNPLVALGGWIGNAVKGAVGLGIAFRAVAAESGYISAIGALLSRVSPWAWVAIGVGALVGLIVTLDRSKSAVQQFNASIQDTIKSAQRS